MELPKAFEESILDALKKRREGGQFWKLSPPAEKFGAVNFGSNDSLSFINSGVLREEVLREIDRNPGFKVGAGGSRINDGTTDYNMQIERHIAKFHNGEDGLFFSSGYDANVAIYSSLPQSGDAIIYDSLIHASIHDGMKDSRASIIKPFAHNDPLALRRELEEVKKKSMAIREGKRVVFVTFESVYSMDGDLAAAQEIVDQVKEALPHGNYVLSVDEAHATGMVGRNGAGYISSLGLEKEFAIRLHTYGKALGSVGAIVICPPLVKDMFMNYSRNFIFTTAPSFLMLATVKAAYNLLASEEGQRRRDQLQRRIRLFYKLLHQHPQWQKVQQTGHLKVLVGPNWEKESFLSAVTPLMTKAGKCLDLEQNLRENGLLAHSVRYPVAPKDEERIRVVMHVENTDEQIEKLVEVAMNWACSQSSPRQSHL